MEDPDSPWLSDVLLNKDDSTSNNDPLKPPSGLFQVYVTKTLEDV